MVEFRANHCGGISSERCKWGSGDASGDVRLESERVNSRDTNANTISTENEKFSFSKCNGVQIIGNWYNQCQNEDEIHPWSWLGAFWSTEFVETAYSSLPSQL